MIEGMHERTPSTAVEAEPSSSTEFFGSGIERAREYAELLAKHGEQLGLLGPLEYPRLWTRHILNSVLAKDLFAGRVMDVGSGGGLPGIPLAIARPDVHFTLVEPMERRSDWLNRCVTELDLDNVEVRRARVEELHGALTVDQVTARAVASLSKLVPLIAPILEPQGEMVLLKGQAAEREIEAAAKVLRKHRFTDVRVQLVGEESGIEPTRVVLGTKA